MPFRNLTTLESWLAEFHDLGHSIAGSAKVVVQDGEDGADTGLIALGLSHALTVIYIQPASRDARQWLVTMEPSNSPLVLDTAGMLQLSRELATIGELCGFLEEKSLSYTATDTA